jgi:hypothetical protein
MPRIESLEALLAREEELAREWQWLHDALNEVARARAEHGDAATFRLMQHSVRCCSMPSSQPLMRLGGGV